MNTNNPQPRPDDSGSIKEASDHTIRLALRVRELTEENVRLRKTLTELEAQVRQLRTERRRRN